MNKIEVFVRHCFSSIHDDVRWGKGISKEQCVKNLIESIHNDPNVNFTFLLDDTGHNNSKHFLEKQFNHKVVRFQGGSEYKSFRFMLDYVSDLNLPNETIIYFLEDDYLHRTGWPGILREAYDELDVEFVSLYDHKDKYILPMYRTLKSQIFITSSTHWRGIPSTVNTFSTRAGTLRECMPTILKYDDTGPPETRPYDHYRWLELEKQGNTLISPIPGWSTHLQPGLESPLIDWNRVCNM